MWGWITKAASSAASWVVDHRAAIASTLAAVVVGTLVTVAAAAFIVATGGLGAGVVAGIATAALAGAAGGAAAGATGYVVDVALDEKKKFSGGDLGKAVLVGALIGGLTGGVLKGVGGGVAAKAADEVAEVTAREVAKRAAVNGVIGATVGGGTQIATNAVENVANHKPVTEDLFRGVPQAMGVGAGVGIGSTLAEPLLKPLLDRVAAASTRAGRSLAGRGSVPAGELGESLPVQAASEGVGAEVGRAPEAPATGTPAADVATAEARAPPEPPRTGIVQILENGETPTGTAGGTDAVAAADAPTTAASNASSNEPAPDRNLGALGEEPDPISSAGNPSPAGIGKSDLSPIEASKIQDVVDKAGIPLDVTGSAATGGRRNPGSTLPFGKGPGTRSDIDYYAPSRDVKAIRELGLDTTLPEIDKNGIVGGVNPGRWGPYVHFEPGKAPQWMPGDPNPIPKPSRSGS